MGNAGMHQIGEVADAVGLSIRTIRHYDDMGIVAPSGRSPGGFRLYTDRDVDRLRLVKRLKPLQFSLEEILELLGFLDALGADRAEASTHDGVSRFVALADERCRLLRAQLVAAEAVADDLRAALPAVARPRH